MPPVQQSIHLSLTQLRNVMRFRDTAREDFVREIAGHIAEDIAKRFGDTEVSVVVPSLDPVSPTTS